MTFEIQASVREAQDKVRAAACVVKAKPLLWYMAKTKKPLLLPLTRETVFYALEKEAFHRALIKFT